MFDALIKELATRFGLGEKALPLVQLVLAFMANKQTGGLSGFIEKFGARGLGDMAQSWIGGGANAKPLQNHQVESLLGGNGGLLSMVVGKLGLNRSTASSALGFLVPAMIGKLSSGGKLPAGLPPELGDMLGAGQQLLGAAPSTAAGGRRWWPWVLAAAALLALLAYCSKGNETTQAVAPTAEIPAPAPAAAAPAAPAPAAPAPAPAAAEPVAEVEPDGMGVVAWSFEGSPALKVFFDSGKAVVAQEFNGKAQTLVDFLKANPQAKAVISGFNDPTGDPAKNAELSKKRAMAVQAALGAVGIPVEQTLLEKPAASTDTSLSKAAARRVEVVVRK